MSPRAHPARRATLEGLFGGAVAGAFMLSLERSSTFSVFADLLGVTFRTLGRFASDQTVIRLDTEAFALAAYVGGSALVGAAVGALLGAARRAGWGPGPAGRALLIGALLALVDLALFGALWRHRGLPFLIGGTLVAAGGVLGAAAAWVVGLATRRLLSERTCAVLAGVAPAAVALAFVGMVIVERRAPTPPPGPTVVSPAATPGAGKVAIIAIDGLDWEMVDEAVSEGRMPNFARLISGGTRGNLRSIRPPKSPVVWTSVVTGMLPSVHGIRNFVIRRAGQDIPVTSTLRRSPALWNLAALCGFTVSFTNWYVTWPAEPVVGAMISDRVDFDDLADRVFPPELTAVVDSARARVDARDDREIARFTRLDDEFPEWRVERWGQVRRALGILDDVVRHDLVTLEAARETLRGGQPDLTALYFRGNDNTQHLFWKYRFAERRSALLAEALWNGIGEEDVRALAAVIDRYYNFADRLLGEALAMLEPDTAVLVLSDHGFLTNNERSRWFHANRILEAAGLAVLAPGAGGAAVGPESVVFDPLAPTVDVRRVLRAGGRAGDFAQALERARQILAAARTDAGDPLFRRLEPGTDEDGPFLAVEFTPKPRGETATVGETTLAIREFLIPEGHSGNHRMNGLLLAAGAPFREGARVKGMRAMDVAPTVLHLLGAPAARDMEGVVFTEAFRPEWLAAHPVRYVSTYGSRETEGDAIPTAADERIREELEALGYLQ